MKEPQGAELKIGQMIPAQTGSASEGTRDFAQVGRKVGIEATPACCRLNGSICRDKHENWIASRVAVTDPGQRSSRASNGEDAFARFV